MAFIPRVMRTLLLIPLTWAALASTPVFADTIIIRQPQPAPVVVVQGPPPPVYYGHWGYAPRGYWVRPHYYGYAPRPYYGGWHHGYYWH